jgi:S1-C subfamily serine protease
VADEVAVGQDSSSLLSIRPALDVADMYAGVAPSVVKILVSDGAGSGVRVAAGIVTNAHVVGDETSVTVVLGDAKGRKVPATGEGCRGERHPSEGRARLRP